jgi:nitrite reductase/ring-hydroxylating ferredoxin subunit
MAYVKVGSLATFPPGSLAQVQIGEGSYAICNSAGEVHALDGICPHAAGPLGQGALHGTTIVCPWHAWEFDCRSGACDLDADLRQTKFPVKIEGDDILVDVP